MKDENIHYPMLFNLKQIFILVVVLVFAACDAPIKRDLEDTAPTTVYTKDNLEPCIKKELALSSQFDAASYKSLQVLYFQEVEDYTKKKPQKLDERLGILMTYMDTLLQNKKAEDYGYKDSIQYNEGLKVKAEIDSINQVLRTYRKEVVGYVFVHTYKTLDDTLSVIFLMDTKCMYTEAIEVNAVPLSLNPDDYKTKIRQ
jgi:hypothetical protein